MKILFLSQGASVEDHIDFDIGFRNAKSGGKRVEFRNVPYKGYAVEHGWDGFYHEVLRQNEDFRPDVVFFHFFHSGGDTGIADCCRELRVAANKPLIFGSSGDLFNIGWLNRFGKTLPRSLIDLSVNADATFLTCMGGTANFLAKKGSKNIVFVPHAFLPHSFSDWETIPVNCKKHAISMVGSKSSMITRCPLMAVPNAYKRSRVVGMLRRRFGQEFSIFGNGWPSSISSGSISYFDQVRLFAESRAVVDSPAPLKEVYYGSDRPFFILGSGSPLVHFHTPRFEKMLRPDEHAFYCYRLRDVVPVCERITNLPINVLAEHARKIRIFVKERHLLDHRIDTILSVAEAIIAHRRGEFSAIEALRAVRMHHFLPEIDLEAEYEHCTRNWVS